MPAPWVEPFGGAVRHVYVHVPFCRARCDYCDFVSQAVGDEPDGELLDRFVAAIGAEWELERAAHDVRRLETLYLGGGTPSLLGPDRLERLLERFRPFLTAHAEVTVETNPEDVDDAYARWVATSGVRVSLGVQSFVPALRDVLGRRAEADPAGAYTALRAAGAGNVGLDLIHGVPGQTPELLGRDLAEVLRLRPDHVSWYELGVVEGTRLARRLAAASAGGQDAGRGGALDPAAMPPDPGDDARAAGYRRIVRELSRAGYGWYEVSNFALPGRRARHNVAYWRARPYLGLGPGAVSTVGGRRWRDRAGTDGWLRALEGGGRPPREREALDTAARLRERLLLAARTGEPVAVAGLAPVLAAEAVPALAAAGLVSLHSGTIRVTRKGRYVANEVCVRLFRAVSLKGVST